MFDRMPLGPMMAIANELRSVVPQRSALAGMLYLQLRRLREGLADREASAGRIRRANASETEKGRDPFRPGARRTEAERLELGRELLARKRSMPWGEFGRWLAEQPFATRTGHAAMRLAREAEELQRAA